MKYITSLENLLKKAKLMFYVSVLSMCFLMPTYVFAAQTLSIGNGSDLLRQTVAPGVPVFSDAFSLVMNSGTDSVTAITVVVGGYRIKHK